MLLRASMQAPTTPALSFNLETVTVASLLTSFNEYFPVSYTHLDVYKRQFYGRAAEDDFLYLLIL